MDEEALEIIYAQRRQLNVAPGAIQEFDPQNLVGDTRTPGEK